jgi:hypothetical protein
VTNSLYNFVQAVGAPERGPRVHGERGRPRARVVRATADGEVVASGRAGRVAEIAGRGNNDNIGKGGGVRGGSR